MSSSPSPEVKSLVYRISNLQNFSPEGFIQAIKSRNDSLSQLEIEMVSAAEQPNGDTTVLLRIHTKVDMPMPKVINCPDEKPHDLDKNMWGLTTIVAPKDHKLDIIAISGLNGNAYGSFKVHGGDHMWLLDSLSKRVADARITLYGYSSDYSDNVSNLSIPDFGEEFQYQIHSNFGENKNIPMVFIVHSLGGLVLQEAFERSIQRPVRGTSYWHNLVRGLIFFGVPTCGMDNAALIGVGASPSFPLLYNLGQSSPNLEKDFNTFVDLALASGKNIHVFCFAESQNTPTVQKDSNQKIAMNGHPEWIVRPESAKRIAQAFKQRDNSLKLTRNHTNLVKFTWDDKDLQTVIQIVKDICEEVRLEQTQSGAEVSRTASSRTPTAGESTLAGPNVPNTRKARTTELKGSDLKNTLLRQFQYYPETKDTDIPELVYAKMRKWLERSKNYNHSGNNLYVHGKERVDSSMLGAMSRHIISELIGADYWPIVFKLAHSSSAALKQALANLWGQLEIQCELRLGPTGDDEITPLVEEELIRALKAYHVPQTTDAWEGSIIVFHVGFRYGDARGESKVLDLVSKVLKDLQKTDKIQILVVAESNCQPLKELFTDSEKVGAVLHATSRSLGTLRM